ncbi:MAG: hypothetical protein LW817_04395 [Candidatus Caenarcaniphilales bacterium]|jgi:UPF0042 nucleotide-binding protein|nr:hypothetical protein [Candidatus Caenarcaniphilales bacterium]
MRIKFISYGHKFYEEQNIAPPNYDFLFSLRDLKNPFWVPELKEYNGLDPEIHEYFSKDENIQSRLSKICEIIRDFIEDFSNNEHKNEDSELVFAFKCTGGKHRSVYFAQKCFEQIQETKAQFSRSIDCMVEHVDLSKYLPKANT